MRKRRVSLLSLAVLFLAARAGEDVIYSYAGNPFTTFTCGYSCPPECSLSGTFEANRRSQPISVISHSRQLHLALPTAILHSPNTNTNPTFTHFCVSTRFDRNNRAVRISFPDASVPNTFLFLTDNGCGTPVGDESAASALCSTCIARQAYNLGNPGIWSPGISPVPEPNTFLY
jgi:hypothetical protein